MSSTCSASTATTSRSLAWAIWVIASIFYAYQYILRVMPNIMLNDIMEQFGIGAATFGQFSGVYYIGYSLMHLPIGIMLDRYGPRKVMSGCILLTILGLTPLLFSNYWAYPIIGRFFIGIGSSAAILGVFKIVRMTFSEGQFPKMLSLSVTIGLIGAIYGGGPMNYMRDSLGYQPVILIFAAAGIVLAAVTYWIVPEMTHTPQGSISSEISQVLTNKKVIFSCLFAGMMVGPLEGFADVWGTVFLKKVYQFDGTIAASMPSMIFIGMCFGAPVLSFIADKIGNYLIAIIGAGAIMTLFFGIMLFWTISPTLMSISFIIIGICCAYQILAIYKASTYASEEVAGLTTAVANMIIMTFGYAFHSIIGGVVNAMGGAEQANALLYGLSVIPIALSLGTCGFIALHFLEEKAQDWSQS